MKLPRLKSTCLKLDPHLPAFFSPTAVVLVALAIFVLICTQSSGPFGGNVAAATASSAAFQDELQLQLGENGFTPSEVQHASGTFAIAVENSALSGEYTLQLKAHDGTVVKEVQVQAGSAAWTMSLSAGEYTLTETSHPQWLCRITVQ